MVQFSEKVRQLVHQVWQSARRSLSKIGDTPPMKTGESVVMNEALALDEATVKELMRRLEATEEGIYSCEETFALLDEYVELVAGDKDVAALMPLVRNHIKICPDCREACETLLRILESESSNPAP